MALVLPDQSKPPFTATEDMIAWIIPYVDVSWYLTNYVDVKSYAGGPARHYHDHGSAEGRWPNPYFNPIYYTGHFTICPPSGMLLRHYVEEGWRLGLAPSAEFDPRRYIRTYPDIAMMRVEPLAHFITQGRAEGRRAFQVDDKTTREKPTSSERIAPPVATIVGDARLAYFEDSATTKLERSSAALKLLFRRERLDLQWIIPDFVPGAGGHMAIFKMIFWLEFLGHRCTIWIRGPHNRSDALSARNDIVRYFQPLKADVRLLEPMGNIIGDVIICTDSWTVWAAQVAADCKIGYYFVQDFEPYFEPMGSNYLLAEETYRLGLPCFCSSPWLEEKMRAYGARATSFVYPVDQTIYHPKEIEEDERRRVLGLSKDASFTNTIHIAFYARQFTSRRAVELGMLGLAEYVKHRSDIVVHIFGQDYPADQLWPFPAVQHGVLSESKLADLFRACDIAMVLSATNYSISSLEAMGVGLPLLDIATDSTRQTYPKDAVYLAKPLPSDIARTLAAMVNDKPERLRRADAARRWVLTENWEGIARKFVGELLRELDDKAFSACETIELDLTPVATVCIPTYNAGPRLKALLDTICAQRTPWPFEIIVIDSGSSDGSIDHLRENKSIRLIEINKADFNHGGTRNLGIAEAHGEFVAFLTQDAEPGDDLWLFNLVGMLRSVPNAACAFGRHVAHADADPFTVRDIDEHFALFANLPPIINQNTDRDRFLARDPDWTSVLRFMSDNNSAYRKSIWETLKLRNLNFGEDQAYGWDSILSGYDKIYVHAAVVRHSHNYTGDEFRERARVEAMYFRDVFGSDVMIQSEDDFWRRLMDLASRDTDFAFVEGVDDDALQRRLELNFWRLKGYDVNNVAGNVRFPYIADFENG